MNTKHLFIVGAGRSGTTFLWRILNNSPEVHLCTEIHYFSRIYHNGFLKNFQKWKKTIKTITPKELYSCLTELNHFGMYWIKNPDFKENEVEEYFRNRKIREKDIYEFLFRHDLQLTDKNKHNVKYLGEKTPANIFHLCKIFSWFPEAKAVFIFRNPINVLKSEANKERKPDYPIKKSNPLYNFGIILFVFFEWILSSIIALYYRKVMGEAFIIVNYESIIESKHTVIKNLCDQLKIDFFNRIYEVDKIDSSFSTKQGKIFWSPSTHIKIVFSSLNFLFNRLKKHSIQ